MSPAKTAIPLLTQKSVSALPQRNADKPGLRPVFSTYRGTWVIAYVVVYSGAFAAEWTASGSPDNGYMTVVEQRMLV